MTTNITKLRRTMAYSWELFFEQMPDGKRILRHIRVNNTRYEVPTDVTIDSIGSEQIIDGTVAINDLDKDIQKTLSKASGLALSSETAVRNIVSKEQRL